MSSRILANRRLRKDEGGAVLAETAITLPVIILLIFGIIEIGIYLWQWNGANKATQLGARLAVTSDPVAIGPGLTWSPVTGPLGTDCRADDTNLCFEFEVACTMEEGCISSALDFTDVDTGNNPTTFAIDLTAFNAIVQQMQRVYPGLDPNTVEIRYVSNGVGFIGFPGHIPNDVTVEILTNDYPFAVIAGFVNMQGLRIRAETTLSSEDLSS